MEDNEQADAAALAAAQAGYERRAGITPAPSPEPVKSEPPLAQAAPSEAPAADAPAAPDDEPIVEAEPAKEPSAIEAISSQLEDLKAQIREQKSQGVDSQTVHRLFGEIGGLTRIVKKLQSQVAPTNNELAGAMAAAEKAAKDYPEIGQPMLEALKALAAKLPEPAEAEPEPEAAPPAPAPAAEQFTPEQKAAIKFLNDLHPDRLEVNKTREFQTWLSAKPADYRTRFTNSWDFAFIAKGYDEFKAAQAARRKKQERLEAAQQPQGAAQSLPHVLPDEAGFTRGYERGKAKRHF
jgi:hypothetical protein